LGNIEIAKMGGQFRSKPYHDKYQQLIVIEIQCHFHNLSELIFYFRVVILLMHDSDSHDIIFMRIYSDKNEPVN